MGIDIREAKPEDFEKLEEILFQNDMLHCPEIDGKDAMKRIKEISGRYFLIAKIDNYVVGLIRGCYDGSRALIHQMAVDKEYQRQGIGKKLMKELVLRFKEDGASSVSVTSTEKSKSYYESLNFSDLPITLMVASDINKVLEKTK